MKRVFVSFSLLYALALVCAVPARAQFTILHSFTYSPSNNGAYPYGSLIQSGSTLYGMTYQGGSAGNSGQGFGTIFKIEADGTGFSVLHPFSYDPNDGLFPWGSLIQSGSALYGMTPGGGINQPSGAATGTIFKIGIGGTGFSLLHSFTGIVPEGSLPYGSLIQSGSTLYGMTSQGGSGGNGTIFKIGDDGTGFSTLHSFPYDDSEGHYPYGSLIQSGPNLYGMTRYGGSGSAGTIFKIGDDGTGFSLLHSFTGGASDGGYPYAYGSLIQSGSTLYGMTLSGGSSGRGTIFKIGTDGTGFSLLHSFTGVASDGSDPVDSLILSGSTLYGMTSGGGGADRGTIFEIGTDGTGFSLLHSFTGGASDGYSPYGSLIQSGASLYGMSYRGGSADRGTIFSLIIPEPSTFVLAALALSLCLMRCCRLSCNDSRTAACPRIAIPTETKSI